MQFSLVASDEIAIESGNQIRAHRLAEIMQQSELAAHAGVLAQGGF